MYMRACVFVPKVLLLYLFCVGAAAQFQTNTGAISGPTDHREAYFNGSSYIRLLTTISLQSHIGLSFRTCIGGELFSQKHNSYNVALVVAKDGLEFSATTPNQQVKEVLPAALLDNRWHTVTLKYRLGNLTLSTEGMSQLIANGSYNSELLTNRGLYNDQAILIIGKQFSGCILEGPSVVFNMSLAHTHSVTFGPCPMPSDSCAPPHYHQQQKHPQTAELDRPPQTVEDHCYHEPCMGHGTCVSRADRYECHCTARYSGNNCEFDNGPPCARKPSLCLNGATCLEDRRGDYTCTCTVGFTGKHCESEIVIDPLCTPNPCMNNGTCRPPMTPGASVPECECSPGFRGLLCETDVNECASAPCLNRGTCVDLPNNYTCHCQKTGYEGPNCEQNVDECLNNPCMNGGVCFDTYGSYVCHCQDGYDGNNCGQNMNECVSMPCQNGGSCVDKVGGYECLCPGGFMGLHCELAACDGTVCPPYAECRLFPGGQRRCVCRAGYTGLFPNCTEGRGMGRREGACSSAPCLNGGTCVPLQDGTSFNCTCPAGFAGGACEIPSLVCGSRPCRNGAECVDLGGGKHSCLCGRGFTGDACQNHVQCRDSPCRHARACRDFLGGYLCTCRTGWTGVHCDTNVDECVASRPCLNGAACLDTPGHFACVCAPGFTGKNCQRNVDECLSNPCLHGGVCEDRINGYACNCTDDFMGANCERPFDPCELRPCRNNATCLQGPVKKSYVCTCAPGFEGPNCDTDIDECLLAKCPDGHVCVDLIASYDCRCPDGYAGPNCSHPVDPCLKNVCKNGGTCVNSILNYTCICPEGYTGRHCEEVVGECLDSETPKCVHGICVNSQCYCKPGYTGQTCNLDFDECLSQPCRNNATCLNKINSYECVCTPGYTGVDCSININECDSNPCSSGSTCVDGIASFKCICQAGMTGHLCQTNIDDCESSPCLHEGRCIDGLNSYSCNCSDTGYSGIHCETNIDDCLPNPCTNGAPCNDGIKDYNCSCYDGYTGKNCEIDINECESAPCLYGGTCLQRSNLTLYGTAAPSFNFTLPAIFSQQFSFRNASGYECVCVAGVTGKDCELNINECESSPCRGGTCIDKIGGYLCECEEGFEGEHCEHDIDECLKYKPCVYGECIDRRANYYCDCNPSYGGKNCSVELIGCMQNPCLNGGTCKPYLENEVDHKFNCSCQNGFHGDTCERVTTMSLSGTSYIAVNTSRDEGYDIQFRFKTTLADGLLAIGKGLTYYILELVHGRLNLHSSLLNKWEGVFIGSGLNDSNWQKVFVAINSSHLVLAANEEQTIYPINLNEGSNATHTSFPTTYLGGSNIKLGQLTHGPHSFVGCTEDVIINGEWVLPQNTSWMSIVDIEVGCSRTPQCDPNPCHSGGLCTDKWRTFNCTCKRPYLGNTCQYNYTAATFGHENTTSSVVTVHVHDVPRRAVRSIVVISMFIRTRQSRGQIFHLGSPLTATTNSNNDVTFISAQLDNGELLVRMLFNNGTPESFNVGGVKLDNGFDHLIEVFRNVTLVKVKLNGTEYFRKTISATGQLDAQVLYLGGVPEVLRPVRQTENSPISTTISSGTAAAFTTSNDNFKGVIQDVQISNESGRMVVEFFPLKVKDLKIPTAFGTVTFDPNSIVEGVVSDDLCRENPCEHNGTCTVTWNDFTCQCPKGFKGKTCSDLEFCQLQECPGGSICRNLENGYECIANVTFTGQAKPLTYNLTVTTPTDETLIFDSVEINYRTRTGGTLMYIQHGADYFFVYVYKGEVIVQWSLGDSHNSHRFAKDEFDGSWSTLYFIIRDRIIYGGFKELVTDDTANFSVDNFNGTAFSELFARSTLYIGGSDKKSYELLSVHDRYSRYNTTSYVTDNTVTESNTVDIPINSVPTEVPVLELYKDKFKGCMGEIRLGNVLVPYFTTSEVYKTDNIPTNEYFSLLAMAPGRDHSSVGCRLCYESDCLNGGTCLNANSSYECDCALGYTAEDCSININECLDNGCQNGGTCIDGIANYTCLCAPGFEGWLCDVEIDECASNPCRNGAICEDRLAAYFCNCTDGFIGPQCEARRLITCNDEPCRNGSTCTDTKNAVTGYNYTCECTRGMVGALCDIPFCHVETCVHGDCNVFADDGPTCTCDRGFTGRLCADNINDCLLANGQSPCQNGGICLDEIENYMCNCTNTGHTGLLCELDIDECATYEPCGQNGTCVNTPGSYECQCPLGYCGNYCLLPDPCLPAQKAPCVNGRCVPQCAVRANFECDCYDGYAGRFCNETKLEESSSTSPINIALIVVPIVVVLLLMGAAALAIFIAMARSKRATRGTYSPSAQEFCNPRVELDHVLKPPPEERLI